MSIHKQSESSEAPWPSHYVNVVKADQDLSENSVPVPDNSPHNQPSFDELQRLPEGTPARPGVWSRSNALEKLGGDEVLLVDASKIFLEEMPAIVSNLKKAVETADAKGIERAAHSLKGALNCFGANCASVAAELERSGHRGEVHKVAELHSELERQLSAFARELQKVIDEAADRR